MVRVDRPNSSLVGPIPELASSGIMYIPYSGKFSRVLIFAVSADHGESAKFYTSNF